MMQKKITEEMRRELLYASRDSCCQCEVQAGSGDLVVHHLDRDDSNNDPDNLVVLCLSHHSGAHQTGGHGMQMTPARIRDRRDRWVAKVRHERELGANLIKSALSINDAEQWIDDHVMPKLGHLPEEQVREAPAHLALPAVAAAQFTVDEIRELYASLIATAMDGTKTGLAHPSFVEIIKSLTPDEVQLLRYCTENDVSSCGLFWVKGQIFGSGFGGGEVHEERLVLSAHCPELKLAGCTHLHRAEFYLENLERLGLLVTIEWGESAESFARLYEDPDFIAASARIDGYETPEGTRSNVEVRRIVYRVTALAKEFCVACVTPPS